MDNLVSFFCAFCQLNDIAGNKDRSLLLNQLVCHHQFQKYQQMRRRNKRKQKNTQNYKHLNRCLQMSWYLINTNINYSIGILLRVSSPQMLLCFMRCNIRSHCFLLLLLHLPKRFNRLQCTGTAKNSTTIKIACIYDDMMTFFLILH